MADSFPIRLGGQAVLDAQELLRTRLLVTGNSGCGKSWLARVLIEAVASKIPFFVIDPEGEFVSLREKIDLVVVSADGGDSISANPTASARSRPSATSRSRARHRCASLLHRRFIKQFKPLERRTVRSAVELLGRSSVH